MARKCFISSYLTVCLVLFKENEGSMRLAKEIWVSLQTDTANTTANFFKRNRNVHELLHCLRAITELKIIVRDEEMSAS